MARPVEYKDYCGCRIYPDGRVYLDTKDGWVLPKTPRKVSGRLVLEAFRGIPEKARHRNVWYLDGNKKNIRLDNLQWGEISQKDHIYFLQCVIHNGFANACRGFKVSPEFGVFMVFLKYLEEDEKRKFLMQHKL